MNGRGGNGNFGEPGAGRDNDVNPGRRRTVVHVVEHMAPGGIETLGLDLLANGSPSDAIFSLSGRKQDLVSRWPALQGYAERIEAFERPLGLDPLLALRIARRLARRKPHAVVAHHIGPLLYGGLAATLAGVPRLVYLEHDVWHYAQPRHRMLLSIASRLFRPRLAAVSHQVADTMREILPHARIAVIHPGIDLSRFVPGDRAEARRRIGLASDVKLIGTVARLVPEKGLISLVQALPELGEDVHVAIAGDGPDRDLLQRTAADLNVSSRLHLLGHRDDVAQLYPAFDVFCLPSLAEGLPRSVLEAQACAVPVVATSVGALADAVCRRTGLLVPPGDAGALARALRRSLEARSLGLSPRAHIQDGFSLSSTVVGFRAMIAGA